jgi:solute carrier family 25 S-adenosylmethionine transporter 26
MHEHEHDMHSPTVRGRCSLAQPDGRRNTVRAWASSLLRDVPMGAVQIAIFEVLKAYVIQRPDISFDTNTLQAEAAFGAIGGFIGAVITTPADVVTVRIMTRQQPQGRQSANEAPVGALEMAREIYATEGAAGFLSGAVSRGLYWAPAIGIFLSLYCSLRQVALALPL